jgi:hypothetical protein
MASWFIKIRLTINNNNNNNNNIIIIIFACKLNRPVANYKVSMSKKKQPQNACKQNTKQGSLCNIINNNFIKNQTFH